jgi:flagellar biosynthetic protein FlhB
MEDNDAQDRQLPATERKIQKARKEGQVARSRDLGHFAAFAAGSSLLAVFAADIARWLAQRLADGLRFDAKALVTPQAMLERLGTGGTQFLVAVLPVGAALLLVALAAGVAAGGWNFSMKAMEPRLQKLDPIAGIGRVFSLHQLGEMLKASALALLLGAIGALYLHHKRPQFADLIAQPLPAALATAGSLVWGGVVLMLLALGAFALVDVPLQRQLLLRRLRMSFEELKKEQKDVEGNAEVKAKVRLRMREMASRRMMAAVPGADLVVMNPTHYAVALKYDEGGQGAPRVVAKGADLVALRIRELAQEHKVPVLQAPALARALYAHCQLEQEIPTRLFGVVAQVLAWVYQLRDALSRGQRLDLPPPPVDVPADMDPADPAYRRAGRPDTGPGAGPNEAGA